MRHCLCHSRTPFQNSSTNNINWVGVELRWAQMQSRQEAGSGGSKGELYLNQSQDLQKTNKVATNQPNKVQTERTERNPNRRLETQEETASGTAHKAHKTNWQGVQGSQRLCPNSGVASFAGRIWSAITSQRHAKAVPIQRILQMPPTNAGCVSLFLEGTPPLPSAAITCSRFVRTWRE